MIGAAIASLLLVGSVGGTVLAAQNSDIVKKNVLMTEKVELNDSKDSIAKTNNISSPVNEEQAVDIARNALKTVFDVEITDVEYSLQTEYFDKSQNAASFEGKAIWTVYWNKKQTGTTKANIDFNSAFIDAETGEVLSMSSQKTSDPKATEVLSNDAAKSMVANFVQSKKLNNGASIKEIQVTASPKKVTVVEVTLENGKGITVLISNATNKIMAMQNHLEN